jgi:hypothetical protein
MSKIKILIVTDSAGIHSGLAETTRNIFIPLIRKYPDKYEIHQLGFFHFAPKEPVPWPVYQTKIAQTPQGPQPDMNDKYGEQSFHELVQKVNPDIVFGYGDMWHFDHLLNSPMRNTYRMVAYYTIDGQPYSLAQFHFHAPSEHRISGVPADMELHFVHKNSFGALAVVGVMIHELAGRENKAFKPIWDLMPRDFHTKSSQPTNLTLASLMPSNRQYFHYSGSLTTPPCSEGVRWFVLANPITLSSGQIEMYTSIFGGPTNRPIQPLQGRDVITNGTPVLAH